MKKPTREPDFWRVLDLALGVAGLLFFVALLVAGIIVSLR